jgi:hypothetical protein
MAPTARLFDNQREANLTSTEALIEDVLISLGHVVEKARIALPGCRRAWRIVKGSALVEVSLLESGEAGWLRVSASVMTVDDQVDRLALWSKLLALNGERSSAAAFGLRGDTVVLVGQRDTLDLDRSEVQALIEIVSADADRFDDELVLAFGGRLGA